MVQAVLTMQPYQRKEMKAAKQAVDHPYITVYWMQHEWTAPDNPNLRRWKLIIGSPERITWAYTYNPKLAELGMHYVEYYKDSSMRNCVRAPKKG